MTSSSDPRKRTDRILASLAPGGRPFGIHIPLVADECHWFNVAFDARLLVFEDCPQGCPRLRKQKVSGPDHFVTRAGVARHMLSAPHAQTPTLNREYLPHVAAYARAIYELGYDPARSSFSRYRTFSRDLIQKRARQSYETDAELDDAQRGIYLHIEAKACPREVARMAAQLDRVASLAELPTTTVEEVEYVLDLAPRYFWLVGPGTVDPEQHVFQVGVEGLNARFVRRVSLPAPPTTPVG